MYTSAHAFGAWRKDRATSLSICRAVCDRFRAKADAAKARSERGRAAGASGGWISCSGSADATRAAPATRSSRARTVAI